MHCSNTGLPSQSLQCGYWEHSSRNIQHFGVYKRSGESTVLMVSICVNVLLSLVQQACDVLHRVIEVNDLLAFLSFARTFILLWSSEMN